VCFFLTFQKDSAYHYLNIALRDDTSLWALADSDLYALIDDPRWLDIEEKQLERFQKNNKKLEQPEYALKLLNIIRKDQAKGDFMKNGIIPHWYYLLDSYKQVIIKDQYNTLLRLIEQYVWPKYATVGKLTADAPLVVINHHESEAVRKKYLP
jgi:hypothetical protein